MKKLSKIQVEHKSLSIEVDGSPSFVKIYTKTGKLLRISRFQNSTSRQVIFYGEPDEYIVESDGKIKTIKSDKKSLPKPKARVSVRNADEEGIKVFLVNGLPFDKSSLANLVNKKVVSQEDIKEATLSHYEKVEKERSAEILTDDLIRKAAIGTLSPAEKKKIKTELTKVTKEKERIKKAVGSAKDLSKILEVKTDILTIKKRRLI